jgi:hypothetical protein
MEFTFGLEKDGKQEKYPTVVNAIQLCYWSLKKPLATIWNLDYRTAATVQSDPSKRCWLEFGRC